jgi:hypothetical protein
MRWNWPDHGWITVPESLWNKGISGLGLSVVDGWVGPTMTSTPDPFTLDGCDDPAGLLAYARAQKRVEDDAAREVFKAAAAWAAMHSIASVVGPVDEWHESCLPLGGEGCPEVAEFAVIEFAAAMGRSTESGRRYLSHAVEGHYRLTACWGRLVAGQLPAWRLQFIAERTICLSPAAAAFVDAKVAPFAHKIGPAQLERLIEEAKARFDPDQTEAERLAAAETRRLDVLLARVSTGGTVHVEGDLDLADAIDFNAALAADAHQQLVLGSTESLDVRRSIAAGNLARHQQALDLSSTPDDQPRRSRRGPVVLHVHLEHAAVLGAGGLARLQGAGGPVTAEQVREWCAHPGAQITVQPVLDLADHLHVGSYEASARLKLQTRLRDPVCVFPFCHRPAEKCDCDHRVAHADDGPTCSCNLAPACRRHHRAKTVGGWRYVTVEPGTYLWRSPLGYQFLTDHTGTLDVTPDPERRRLAHQFRHHFGDAGTDP